MSVPQGSKVSVTAKASTWAFDRMQGKGSGQGSSQQLSKLIGKKAPDFELALLDGEKFKLGDRVGEKVLVLDFWATWCAPCIRAMPEVMAAVEAYADRGVELVTINQQENVGRITGFLRARGWKLEVALDTELAVRELYGVTGIPSTFVIGKDGKVFTMHTGYQPGLVDQLKEDIEAALSSDP